MPFSKNYLRHTILAKRRNLSQSEIQHTSQIIIAHIQQLPQFRTATSICIYLSHDNEVDTTKYTNTLLASGKICLVPKVDIQTNSLLLYQITSLSTLSPGYQGIPEPNDQANPVPSSIIPDAMLVPGIAFSEDKYRLGYGKGYYDRLLAQLPKTTFTLGLAYSWQIIPAPTFPQEAHDIPLQGIVSEQGFFS